MRERKVSKGREVGEDAGEGRKRRERRVAKLEALEMRGVAAGGEDCKAGGGDAHDAGENQGLERRQGEEVVIVKGVGREVAEVEVLERGEVG